MIIASVLNVSLDILLWQASDGVWQEQQSQL